MISGILFNRISVDTTDAYLYGVQILLGTGVGCYLQAGYAVILGVLEMSDMAYGVTFMLFAQLLGITIGLSVGGAIFTNTALQQLRPLLPGIPDDEIQSALSGAAGNLINSFPEVTQQAILTVITSSIGKAYVLCCRKKREVRSLADYCNRFILEIVAGAVSIVAGLCLRVSDVKFLHMLFLLFADVTPCRIRRCARDVLSFNRMDIIWRFLNFLGVRRCRRGENSSARRRPCSPHHVDMARRLSEEHKSYFNEQTWYQDKEPNYGVRP
jgi:hypothetical protein